MGWGFADHIHSGVYVPDIRPGVRFVHDGQFHAGDPLGQIVQPGTRFGEQVARDSHIIPDLSSPDHSDLCRGFFINNIIFPAVHGCDLYPLIYFILMPLSVDILDLCPQREQDGNPVSMITANLYVQQVLAVLHSLRGERIEVRDVIQILHSPCIAHPQEAAVGSDQLVPDGVEGNGKLGVAVGDIIIAVRHGHVADYKPLFLLDRVVMDGDEQFEQAAQGAFVIIGQLNTVLQICKAGLACPGMGIVKIRTVVQRPAFKHNGIALFADDG